MVEGSDVDVIWESQFYFREEQTVEIRICLEGRGFMFVLQLIYVFRSDQVVIFEFWEVDEIVESFIYFGELINIQFRQ